MMRLLNKLTLRQYYHSIGDFIIHIYFNHSEAAIACNIRKRHTKLPPFFMRIQHSIIFAIQAISGLDSINFGRIFVLRYIVFKYLKDVESLGATISILLASCRFNILVVVIYYCCNTSIINLLADLMYKCRDG